MEADKVFPRLEEDQDHKINKEEFIEKFNEIFKAIKNHAYFFDLAECNGEELDEAFDKNVEGQPEQVPRK